MSYKQQYKNPFKRDNENNDEDDSDTEDERDFKKQKINNEVIVIESDTENENENEEDEELQRAIALSLETSTSTSSTLSPTTKQNSNNKTTTTTTSTASSSSSSSATTPNECCDIKFKSDSFYLNSVKNEPRFKNIDTISFHDLIKKKGMERAMICGFVLEDQWIFKSIYACQGKRVPITFVKHYDHKSEKKGMYTINADTMVIHPPLLNYQIFHAKLMLFMYPDFIRIAIPSANPTEHDYINLGQTIWHQDYYIKKTSSSSSSLGTEFLNSLKYFLKSIGVPSANFLDQYDFSTCKVKLITSIPGTYYPNSKTSNESSGVYQMSNHLNEYYKQQQLKSKQPTGKIIRDLYYQSSSLGGDISNFRNTFTKSVLFNNINIDKPLHIIFPTKQWINESKERFINSGCTFLSNKNYGNNNSNFCHFIPKFNYRKELISHSKIIVGTTTITSSTSSTTSSTTPRIKYDWIYTGSHNFSPSAWGAFQKKEKQIAISNFEIGILFTNQVESLDDLSIPIWSNQIPFNIPTTFYSRSDIPYIQENNPQQ